MKPLTTVTLIASLGLLGGAAFAAGHGGWKKADANGDGVISEAELDARNDQLISEADSNGDGALSQEELRAHREKKRAERRAERNPDKNGDGVISYAEFSDAAKERFDRRDKNGDGVLDESEQRRHGKRHRGHGNRGER